MTDFDKTMFGCIGGLLALVALVVVGSLMNGWALSTLWGWFIVPLFGVPSLTIAQAIGVAITVSTFKTTSIKSPDKDEDSFTLFAKSFLLVITTPLMSVGLGRIVLQFV